MWSLDGIQEVIDENEGGEGKVWCEEEEERREGGEEISKQVC